MVCTVTKGPYVESCLFSVSLLMIFHKLKIAIFKFLMMIQRSILTLPWSETVKMQTKHNICNISENKAFLFVCQSVNNSTEFTNTMKER